MLDARGEVIYHIDQNATLTYTNETWDVFAYSNSGKHLVSQHVLGRCLWDFISDPTTTQLYQDLLSRVQRGAVATFTYRCDAPGWRRWMQMTIRRLENGAEFSSRTLQASERAPQPLLDPDSPRSDLLVRMCSWCKMMLVEDEWVEVEEGITRLGLFETAQSPMLTHGICGRCNEEMQKQLVAIDSS